MAKGTLSRGWSEAQEAGIDTILKDVKGAAGPLLHLAYAFTPSKALSFSGGGVRDGNTDKRAADKAADESVVTPLRKHGAVVDNHAGRGDGRVPVGGGSGEFWPGVVAGDRNEVVVTAFADYWPAVVDTAAD